jgi:hypothetical protein
VIRTNSGTRSEVHVFPSTISYRHRQHEVVITIMNSRNTLARELRLTQKQARELAIELSRAANDAATREAQERERAS